jgi:hypothetical protein
MAQQGLGYYSGLLEGRKTLQELSLRERQAGVQEQELQLRRQQEARQLEESQSSNLYRNAQREKLMREMNTEDQTKALLANAFSGTQANRTADAKVSGELNLAGQAEGAAKAMMGTNPKVALELLGEANKIKTQAAQTEVRNLQVKKAQMEIAGDLSSRVVDQGSLDENIGELAKVGVVVPDKYRVWNPETKDWFARRAVASTNALKAIELDLRGKQVDINDRAQKSMEADRLEKQRIADMRETRLRSKVDSSTGKVKPLSEKDTAVEIAALNTMSEDFKGLPAGDRIRAAGNVWTLAADYLRQGQADTMTDAIELARQTVLGSIVDGKYVTPKAGTKTGSPSMTEWMTKAKQANPGASEQELKDFYSKKYGGFAPKQTSLGKVPETMEEAEATVRNQLGI